MATNNIKNILKAHPIIPVLTIEQIEYAVPIATALMAAQINIIEITLRTACAFDAIKAIKKALPDCLIGAGTIIQLEQMVPAQHAGAEFVVSPGISLDLVEAAKQLALPFLPGVVTPSEIIAAIDLGFDTLKFFPANHFGGATTLKDYQNLFPNVNFCPTGGVNLKNIKDYFSVNNVIAVGTSSIVPKNLIAEKNWDQITKIAKQFKENHHGTHPL